MPGRGEGGRDRRHAAAVGVPAARRRGRRRQDTWAAIQGRKALKIDWDDGAQRQLRLGGLSGPSSRAAVASRGKVVRNDGDVDAALAQRREDARGRLLRAAPRARARWSRRPRSRASSNGALRGLGAARSAAGRARRVAKRLGLPPDNVTVNVTLLGGGFGRKSKADFVVEAALLVEGDGRQAGEGDVDARGRPAHTTTTTRCRRAPRGRPRRRRQGGRVAAPQRRRRRSARSSRPDPKTRRAVELGMGLTNLPFDDPQHARREPGGRRAHAHRLVRSVSNIPHAFAVQSFVAELAQRAGQGSERDYLLELLGPARQHRSAQDQRRLEPRRIAGTLSGRHRPAAQGHRDASPKEADWGTQARRRGGAWASPRTTASSPTSRRWSRWRSTTKGEIAIPRVDIAVDCGPQVNPERVRSQIEGAVRHGAEPGARSARSPSRTVGRSRTTSTSSRSCA